MEQNGTTMEKVSRIFAIFEKANPTPETELVYQDSFTLLVAVMLSAQTMDANVNKATAKLFSKANTPKTILALGLDGVKECIKTLNFYPTKAKNLIRICEELTAHHQGFVPSSRKDLEVLPGIGRKTANIVLNIAFGEPTLGVDTHIHRVANRLGLCHTKTPLETEVALLKIIPRTYIHNAHHWLVLHGRYICKALKPLCHICPLREDCNYYQGLV